MKSCAGQDVRKLAPAHERSNGAEVLDDVGDEVRKSVDGRTRLNERVLTIAIKAAHPTSNGRRREEERARSLLGAPSRGGAQREDGQTLLGRVVGSVVRRERLQPCVQDTNDLVTLGERMPESLQLTGGGSAWVGTVLEPGGDLDERVSC